MPIKGLNPRRCDEAARRIEKMIRSQNLWGQRLCGERELAVQLDISRGTLQRALDDLQRRRLVIRRHGSGTLAAERPAAGARLPPAETRPLAILAGPDDRNTESWNYYGDMVAGAFAAACRHSLDARLIPLEEVWIGEVTAFGQPGPAWDSLRTFGAFVVIQHDDPALLQNLLRLPSGPVAICDASPRDLPVINVVDGSFEGACRAVRYLANLGHRRIAYLAPGESDDRPHPKTRGYVAALRDAGLAPDPALIFRPDESRLDEQVATALDRFFSLPDPPTALFAGTDSRALPALAALERHGRRAGRDFAVVGFGDQAFRLGLHTGLTSVRIPTRRMGEAAVEAVQHRQPSAEARTIIIPDRLIVRKSSCPPPPGAKRAPSSLPLSSTLSK